MTIFQILDVRRKGGRSRGIKIRPSRRKRDVQNSNSRIDEKQLIICFQDMNYIWKT